MINVMRSVSRPVVAILALGGPILLLAACGAGPAAATPSAVLQRATPAATPRADPSPGARRAWQPVHMRYQQWVKTGIWNQVRMSLQDDDSGCRTAAEVSL
jgi:hypothetical protein